MCYDNAFWNDGTFLYHHGIPGMKWGVRNGPPYPLGSEQKTKREKSRAYQDKYYEAGKKKDSEIQNISNYIKKSNPKFSDKEAVSRAKRLIKMSDTGRALLTAGVLVGGAIAVYAIVKKDPFGGDFTLPAGSEVFRVQGSGHSTLPNGFFYATADAGDSLAYKGMFGTDRDILGAEIADSFKDALTIGVKNDVKISGMQTAKEVFNELVNTNFNNFNAFNSFTNRNVETFLKNAPLNKFTGDSTAFKIFQEKMLEKGYGGVIDWNDKFGTGLRTKAPVILFNNNSSSSFAIKSVEHLTKESIRKYKPKAFAYTSALEILNPSKEGLIELGKASYPLLISYGLIEASRNMANKQGKTLVDNK